MTDVARLAGVSHQTVSRVINGSPSIRPETKERVLRAIEKLGYRPNTAARALVSGRSGTIGIIATETSLFGPTSIRRTIEEAAQEEGLLATSVTLDTVTMAALDDAVDHLVAHAVEGLVMIAPQDEALETMRARRSGIPCVIVEGDLSQNEWTVGVDQVAGARMATEHLLSLGHRSIAHIAGPPSWGEARARREAWEAAMAAAGLDASTVEVGDWSAGSGYAAGRRLAARGGFTAVFAANDQMALGLMLALHEEGVRVPDEVSVVGFDDIPEAAYLIPPLTTIRQDFPAVGRAAIRVLRSALSGNEPETVPELIPPQLVVRRSADAPGGPQTPREGGGDAG